LVKLGVLTTAYNHKLQTYIAPLKKPTYSHLLPRVRVQKGSPKVIRVRLQKDQHGQTVYPPCVAHSDGH